MDAPSAAVQGSSEVGIAIMASTLTTLAVFVPVLFVPGIAGALFRDMVITICFSLTASLVVAVTLIPLLASKFLSESMRNKQQSMSCSRFWQSLLRLPSGIRWPVLLLLPPVWGTIFVLLLLGDLLKRVLEPLLEGALSRLEGAYTGLLRWALSWRKSTVLIGFGTLGVVFGLGSLVNTDFLPKTDDSVIMMQFERSPGTSLAETMKTGFIMESILRKKYGNALESVIVEAGIGKGFAALFNKGSYAGMIRVRMKPLSERSIRKWELIEDLRQQFRKFPDLKVSAQDFNPASFGGQGDIDVKLFGYDIKTAVRLAKTVKKAVGPIEGVTSVKIDVEEGKPEFQIFLDRERLNQLGLNPQTVGQTISAAFKGVTATLFRDRGNEYNVFVQLDPAFRKKRQDIESLLLASPQGKMIPLKSVTRVAPALGTAQIKLQDQQRVATVAINVVQGQMGRIVERVRTIMDTKIRMPEGFFYKLGGKAEDFITSFSWLGVAFLVSVLLVYMVMASQFESLFAPFVIIFSIPLSAIGVILALLLTNT
ncbi:MAG: efflux RND transporter permease subunit, partial [Myxococcota bacterium]